MKGMCRKFGQLRWELGMIIAVLILAMPIGVSARISLTEDLQISGRFFNYTEVRYQTKRDPRRDRNANAIRNEFLLEVDYTGLPHTALVVKLRPFWDGAFEVEDDSFDIRGDWESNFWNGIKDDKWDPFVREVFADINLGDFYARLGRQLVTWGRSDGVLLLDQVNPNNFRNPFSFEQERFRIPLWMINVSYDFANWDWVPGMGKALQVIWIPDYVPSRFPGFRTKETGQHPWELNVVNFADIVIEDLKQAIPGFTFTDNFPDEGPDEWEAFVRWSGEIGPGLGVEPFKELTFSLNYGYTHTDIPVYFLQDRFEAPGFPITLPARMTFEPRQIHFVGGSFDKAMLFLPWVFAGTVIRGEVVYTFGDNFYLPDLDAIPKDHFTYLFGFDQYVYPSTISPALAGWPVWFLSFQLWQDWVINPECRSNCFIDLGENNLFNGLRDQQKTFLTFLAFADWLPGEVLNTRFFALQGVEANETWFNVKFTYIFNTWLSAAIGANFIWGSPTDPIGQFRENDHIFSELTMTF